MGNERAVAVLIGGRHVKKSGRIEDPPTAAVGSWGQRRQPQKHLLRPPIEGTIILLVIRPFLEHDAVCRIYGAVQRDGSRFEPTCKHLSWSSCRIFWICNDAAAF